MSLTSYIGTNVELLVNAEDDVRENILYIGRRKENRKKD